MGELIVIAGPTASGKTSLSLQLAKAFDADIIGADSRQFYKGLNIGTAKPDPEVLASIPHHFVDFLETDETYAAGTYGSDVLTFLREYFTRKKTAILVGGSGLYIKAVTEGFDATPPSSDLARKHYNSMFEREGLAALQEELRNKDPEYFAGIDINNKRRLQRALEAIFDSGTTFSSLLGKAPQSRPFHIHKILILPRREDLYEGIDRRVDEMMAMGLLEEARKLLPWRTCNALQTVGYKELFEYFDGRMQLDEAVDKIKQHTRNYAKRQLTWFKKQEGYTIFEAPEPEVITRHLLEQLNV